VIKDGIAEVIPLPALVERTGAPIRSAMSVSAVRGADRAATDENQRALRLREAIRGPRRSPPGSGIGKGRSTARFPVDLHGFRGGRPEATTDEPDEGRLPRKHRIGNEQAILAALPDIGPMALERGESRS